MTRDAGQARCHGAPIIQSYRDKQTREFAAGLRIREFHRFYAQASRRLELLDNAISKESLKQLPGNHFEALHGDWNGQFSIRINRQWRICFSCPNGAVGPSDVEIAEYH